MDIDMNMEDFLCGFDIPNEHLFVIYTGEVVSNDAFTSTRVKHWKSTVDNLNTNCENCDDLLKIDLTDDNSVMHFKMVYPSFNKLFMDMHQGLLIAKEEYVSACNLERGWF